METPEGIRCCLEEGDFATSIDYKDAYFHILIHERFRKYLRFVFDGICYSLRVLPQGMNISPRVFTRVITPIRQYCHLRQIKAHQYLDDWLIKNENLCKTVVYTKFVIDIAEGCGFVKSYDKCGFLPQQKFEF